MKFVTLAMFTTIALLNTSAFAFPTVGDNAVYSVQQTANAQTINAEMTSTVMAVDTVKDTITVSSLLNGSTTTETKSLSDLMNYYNLVDQCQSVGGITESISAASTSISTCHIHQDLSSDTGPVSGDIWFGKIPFGIVKSVVNQGTPTGTSTQTMLLKSFKSQK